MENFTPFSSISGGLLIGAAAAILLLFNGKVLGVSGIVSRALLAFREKAVWQIVFLIGLIFGTVLYRLIFPYQLSLSIEASETVLMIAGLLVGFGTNLGSGCTSGHGICGIARFSRRSIIATIIFMLAAMITVYVTKHIGGG
ncbi:MAG: YeeE/YedE thiosulfate transporter family protein [Candidatus Omnitrophica bacterium]|nr:YeeE/YedE thiosulfate transporter family protein [Candidatus Omnitrophota bacterium]